MTDVLTTIISSAAVAAIVSSGAVAWNGWRDRVSRIKLQRMQEDHQVELRDADRKHEAELRDVDRLQEVALRELDRQHENKATISSGSRSTARPSTPPPRDS